MHPDRYNIRVYGLAINPHGEVLVTDERRGGITMTKFPGGGHMLGEGLGDALMREFQEECGLPIELLGIYYVNDFLQISAFNPRDQLISIYYLVRLVDWSTLPTTTRAMDFVTQGDDEQAFRWIALDQLNVEDFRFPIDKVVVGRMLQNSDEILALAHH